MGEKQDMYSGSLPTPFSISVVLVVYCFISSPLLLIVIAAAGGASYIASMRNSKRKLTIAGHKVSLAQQYGLISVCSIPFFLWAGAGGIVFWVLGASMLFITAHAAFYNYDALEVAVTQSENQHKENPILSNMGEKQDMYSGSLPTPLSISQAVVREWFDKKKANLRPFRTFFNTANFQVPPSAGRLTKRLYKNIEYFQSNYVLVFLVLVAYCLISSPLLLIAIMVAGGASYIASMKNSEMKVAIAGHEVSLSQQYGLISVCSISFFLWAGAGGIVFWVLGASMFFITAHAAFYNYDALEVAVTQSQNQHKENPILSNMGEKQEHSEVAERLGFVVDELVETCSQSKENAEKFIDMILKKNVERRKSEVLPLQGDLWKQWSELDKESQSIHIYKGMQHFYDVEMGTLRQFIFDEVNKIGNNVKQEDLESIPHASTKLANGTLEVMSKALEKKKKIEEKFDEKVKTSENPDMAAKFLPPFVFDMRRKIESWLESDEKQILNEIRGILKRKDNISHLQQFNTNISTQAQAVVTELHNKNEKVDDDVIEKKFTELFDQWKSEAKQNSLVQHLEKEKKTLRNNFSEDIKATDRDARLGTMIFQDILQEAIAMKTKSGLGQKIYNDILKSRTFMHKSNMMFYLHGELLQATGEEVHRYCNHYKSYVEEWIQNKMRKFCEENAYLEKQVKSRTKTAVEFVIDTVQQAMTDTEENKRTPFAWFELLMKSLTKDGYSEELKVNQTVFENRIKQIKSLDAVSKKMIEGLNEYKSNISQQESDPTMDVLKSLSFNPLENLINERIGCTAQCPFCGAVCDNGIDCAGTKRKHVAELHRPQGFTGMHGKTSLILSTDICSTEVSTDHTYIGVRGVKEARYYKNVATDIPDWTIKPETPEAQEFWQRLFYLHNKKIAEIVGQGVKPAKTPSGWSNVTEEMALQNLKDLYQVLE